MDGVGNSETTSKTRLSRSEINSIKRDSKVKKQVTVVKGNSLSNVPLTPSLITLALVLETHADERVVWVDIEGVTLNVWSRETFLNIGKKWGETMDIEENLVYMARAKALFAWTPIFLGHKESEYISDDESLHGAKNKSVGSQHGEDDLVDDSDVEAQRCSTSIIVFVTYVLNKKPKGVAQDSDSSLSHPPGFTSEVSRQENDHRVVDLNTETDKVNSPLVHTKVINNSQEVHENVTSNEESAFKYSHNAHNGGSILDVLDDMIRWVKELNIKHKVNFLALQETKMDRVNHMDIKFIWGNSNYQYVSSDSAGSSGGILCVWEATIFMKDYATVSDNFIAIYGTWISNNSKVLIVVIYAPRSLSHKRVLWDYISSLIARLNGEMIVMGDFNEVRSIDERFVWNCGENKSLGPDGYTFKFFRRYWRFIGSDFCSAAECFFESGSFSKGSNSSFIALIPKVTDAKFVTDFRPVSLIGCVYKVVTKILANRLATVISDLVFDIQSAFVANRQILDGPFILNELL
nr:RNA-directed DNA polymerase, eukaryota [Tanacetum cinerariifolium]